jgi:hypothetical protein
LLDFIEDLLNEDNINNIRLPFELLLLEIAYVIISIIFEVFDLLIKYKILKLIDFIYEKSFCLYKKGFTPGKYLFNMKIITCTQINELLTPNHIRVIPGTVPTLKS